MSSHLPETLVLRASSGAPMRVQVVRIRRRGAAKSLAALVAEASAAMAIQPVSPENIRGHNGGPAFEPIRPVRRILEVA